jgi:FixJ family two-component response regulator
MMTMLQSDAAVPACTVFLVDDDDGLRSALRFMLESEGLTVRAYSCPEGLLADGKTCPDGCLVTDYNMPGMNGLDLVSALRKRGDSLPAILVTSDPNRTVRDRAAAANVPVIDKLNLADSLVSHLKKVIKARLN